MFLPNSVSAPELARSVRILRNLQAELHAVNPYVQLYEHLCNVQHDGAPLKLALSEKDLPENSTRRYTSHNSPEVAVLMEDEAGDRDIVIRMQGGGVRRMKDTHRAADPLFFVLMHPYGNPGWRLGMTRRTRTGGPKNLSLTNFYRYHLFERKSDLERSENRLRTHALRSPFSGVVLPDVCQSREPMAELPAVQPKAIAR